MHLRYPSETGYMVSEPLIQLNLPCRVELSNRIVSLNSEFYLSGEITALEIVIILTLNNDDTYIV